MAVAIVIGLIVGLIALWLIIAYASPYFWRLYTHRYRQASADTPDLEYVLPTPSTISPFDVSLPCTPATASLHSPIYETPTTRAGFSRFDFWRMAPVAHKYNALGSHAVVHDEKSLSIPIQQMLAVHHPAYGDASSPVMASNAASVEVATPTSGRDS